MRFAMKIFAVSYLAVVITFGLGGFAMLEVSFRQGLDSRRETVLAGNEALCVAWHTVAQSAGEGDLTAVFRHQVSGRSAGGERTAIGGVSELTSPALPGGDALLQGRRALVNGFGAVVQVIDLSAALDFPPDGIVNDGIVVFHHKGLHWITVSRRLFQGRHIPNAGKGHIQSSGDGRCGEGQHIHTLGNLFQPLLVADTEALLLINNQKTQILVFD